MIPIRSTVSEIVPYVPGRREAGAVKLSSNENPMGMSPIAAKAAREAIADASIYPDGGAHDLRNALARVHSLSPERFIVGNGSDEVMLLSAATYLESGAVTLMGAHTFSQYEFATRLFGGIPRTVPMPDGCYPTAAIADAVDATTRMVFLCNPNNPTGRSFSHAALEDLLQSIPDDVLVVEDEAYREYAETADFPRSVELQDRYPNLLVLRTFSKIFGMAGLRVGYGIGRPELIENLNRTKQPFNVGSVAQAAARAALDDVDFVVRSQELTRAGKRFLYAELERLGLTYYETEANFVCIEMNRSSYDVAKGLSAMGVTIRPLASFGLETKIRATIGTREQNELFISCLGRYLEGNGR